MKYQGNSDRPNRVSSFLSRLSLRQKRKLIVSIPILCLTISLIALWIQRQNTLEARRNVDRVQQVLLETNRLLVSLLNAETGVRGYYVTRRSEFLEPYQQANNKIPLYLERLDRLAENNLQRQQQVARLRALSQKELKLLEQNLAIVDDIEKIATEITLLRDLLIDSKETMDNIRVAIDELTTDERNLLKKRTQYLDSQRKQTTLVLWLAIGVSLLGSLVAIYLFDRLERELQQGKFQLSQNKEILSSILANVIDGVILLEREDQIENCNVAIEQMFGYQLSEVSGESLSKIIVDSPKPQNSDREQPFILPQANSLVEAWGKHKNGVYFPVELSTNKTSLNAQKLIIVRDLTKHRHIEATLQKQKNELASLTTILSQKNTDLEERNQELDSFTYAVSHDLKAPIRAIHNLSEWIEEDLEDVLTEDTRSHMNLLRGRVQRMESLIHGLLQYSRVGRKKTPVETVAVDKLINEVVDLLNPPPEIEIKIASNLPTFTTQKAPLLQVFSNLIGNAIKHRHRPEGTIEIAVAEEDEFYKFTVTDDGYGIAPQHYDKIFKIFQTLEARDKIENTGIGLSIVQKIIEQQGGTVNVESQVGKGSAFSFTWLKNQSKDFERAISPHSTTSVKGGS
ncbi:conserved hypothetical protein [Hyella patelloides LEGE 07179]|uniref:histidine kinase n=1 Tax=Hyella patelloides LEGE 07179 TaxID=945734 RepID=A0A563VZF4_9CYAN|nr:ATP-binding protein [Hyella patelloides]VEP16643.1 conserved hypothetical protein [Hyella patelloides LEGE 07179]